MHRLLFRSLALASTLTTIAFGQLTEVKPDVKQKAIDALNLSQRGFLENQGQWDSRAKYLAQTQGLSLWITKNGWVFDHSKSKRENGHTRKVGQAVGLYFQNATQGAFHSVSPVAGNTCYDLPRFKKTGIKAYNEVVRQDIYKGIDLRNYFDGADARHDLIVKPGANPAQIKISVDGAKAALQKDGSIKIGGKQDGFALKGLVAYQKVNGKNKVIASKYAVEGNTIKFKVGDYDHNLPLVLDPVTVTYGSYMAGDGGPSEVKGVFASKDGAIFLTGRTNDNAFPTINNFYGLNIAGGYDAFLVRLQGDVFTRDFAAFFGGTEDDEGDFLQQDAAGNIWVGGFTASSDFPNVTPHPETFAIKLQDVNGRPRDASGFAGTFSLFIDGQFVQAPATATVSQMVTALNTFGVSNVTVTAGTNNITPGITNTQRVSLPYATLFLTFPSGHHTVSINDSNLQSQVEIVPDSRVWTVTSAAAPTVGSYDVNFSNPGASIVLFHVTIVPSDTQQTIQAKVNAAFGFGGISVFTSKVTQVGRWAFLLPTESTPWTAFISNDTTTQGVGVLEGTHLHTVRGTPDPRAGYLRFFIALPPGVSTSLNVKTANDDSIIAAMNAAWLTFNPGATGQEYFALFTNGTVYQNTRDLPMEGAASAPGPTTYNDILLPHPYYKVVKQKNFFIMRWKKDPNLILNPEVGSEKIKIWGSTCTPFVANMKIILTSSTAITDPVKFGFGGNAWAPINELNATVPAANFNGPSSGFVVRSDFNPTTNTFTDQASSHYITKQSTLGIRLTGVDFDEEGSQYITGTINFSGNIDTQASGNTNIWSTTPGIWTNGSLIRGDDVFVRKYKADGTLSWSGLLGGNSDDSTYGPDVDIDLEPMVTGSTLAVAVDHSVYVAGTSRSFDFNRTRDSFAPNFPSFPCGFLTKITADGSTLGFSTSLNNPSAFRVSGVVVDQVGNAWVHGNVRDVPYQCVDGALCTIDHRDDNTINPIPALPVRVLDPAFIPLKDQLSTRVETEAWGSPQGYMMCISADGATQIFGSYFGQGLGTTMGRPFVDSFGDIWFIGKDSSRDVMSYDNPASTTPVVVDFSIGAFSWITNDAFKKYLPNGIGSNYVYQDVPNWSQVFYSSEENYVFTRVFNETLANTPSDQPFAWPFRSESEGFHTGGFVGRLRYRFPAVTNVIVPSTIPPGNGTGTVTFNQAVPSSGVTVVMSSSDVNSLTLSPANVNIPGGANSGTFNYNATQVQVPTPVEITANYANSIQTVRTVITPVLQSLSANPDTFPGGSSQTGNIKLAFAQMLNQSATIQLSTDRPDLVTFPNSAITITGSASGVDSAPFQYNTLGVSTATPVNITATYQNAKVSIKVTLVPAKLIGLTFSPQTINGGASTQGLLQFDGKPPVGQSFTVALTTNPASDANLQGVTFPKTITFDGSPDPNFGNARVFTFTTAQLDTVNVYKVTATRKDTNNNSLESVVATFEADPDVLTAFTLSQATIQSGTNTSGSLTVSNPADPTGCPVTVSSDNPNVLIQGDTTLAQSATVSIPNSSTTTSFAINTSAVAQDTLVHITATRGKTTITQSLTLKAAQVQLDLNPKSVNSGDSSTATVTLSSPAPTGGITFNVASNNLSAATVPPTVTVKAGDTTATFKVDSQFVSTVTVVTITVSSGGVSASKDLTVNGQGAQLTFTPSTVSGGSSATGTITLDKPAVSDLTLTLSSDNNVVATINPTTVTIPANSTSATFNVDTTTVSADTVVNVTVSQGGSTLIKAPLTVTAASLKSMTFSPFKVKGGKSTVCTITLNSPAPTGGLLLTLTDQPSITLSSKIVFMPATVTIPAGKTIYAFTIRTKRVSRSIDDSIVATSPTGSVATATLTVRK